MIAYDLLCDADHAFEGWFRSSAAYADQAAQGLIACPVCGSEMVRKAPMAPAVPRKGSLSSSPPAVPRSPPRPDEAIPEKLRAAMQVLAKAQAAAIKDSTWVGQDFADKSRRMHYGEEKTALIHGEASAREARDLLEEGIGVAPLLIPVTPPDKQN